MQLQSPSTSLAVSTAGRSALWLRTYLSWPERWSTLTGWPLWKASGTYRHSTDSRRQARQTWVPLGRLMLSIYLAPVSLSTLAFVAGAVVPCGPHPSVGSCPLRPKAVFVCRRPRQLAFLFVQIAIWAVLSWFEASTSRWACRGSLDQGSTARPWFRPWRISYWFRLWVFRVVVILGQSGLLGWLCLGSGS